MRVNRLFQHIKCVIAAAVLMSVATTTVTAQAVDAVTSKLKRAGIHERLGQPVDRSAILVDEDGNEVAFADFLDNDRPVILNFIYHSCPMLCSMVLEAMTKSISQIDWTPGDQYEIVSISISDADTPETATRQKAKYVEKLGIPEAAAGWHFLTGTADQVAKVAESVGFGYDKDDKTGEYAHGAALVLLSPSGTVSRYLYGIRYPPFDLRAGLVEASEGIVGNIVDRLIMFCFHYDPAEGSYVPQAWLAMRLAGGLTVVLLGSALGVMWMRERKNSTIVAKSQRDVQGDA